MTEVAEVTRSDLYFPKIGEPREIWTFVHHLTGAVAMFAVHQSPYACPDNLEGVIKKLDALCAPDFDVHGMRKFNSFADVEAYLSPRLRSIPEYLAWNDRKNGNTSPFSFVSRFDVESDPDNSFIDLDALERNAAMHIVQQAILT